MYKYVINISFVKIFISSFTAACGMYLQYFISKNTKATSSQCYYDVLHYYHFLQIKIDIYMHVSPLMYKSQRKFKNGTGSTLCTE